MTPSDHPSRRHALRLLSGLTLAALPLGGERPWVARMAWAGDDDDDRDEDDEDRSGSGSGDEDDDRDDRSGPGSGDDDDDDDEDRDGRSGSGSDDDERDDDERDGGDRAGSDRSDDEAESGRGRHGGPSTRDIAVFYPDGWIERIVDGRYELLDHQSRLVVRRAATAEDFGRMIALR